MNIQPDNCPFCGFTASIETFKVRKGYEATVHCDNCLSNMLTITFDTEEEAYYQAVTDWNTRTITTKGSKSMTKMPDVNTLKTKEGKWVTKTVKKLCAPDCWYPGIFAIEGSWNEEEGSWLEKQDGFCSECGKQDEHYTSHKYCPYCGAKMENKDEAIK